MTEDFDLRRKPIEDIKEEVRQEVCDIIDNYLELDYPDEGSIAVKKAMRELKSKISKGEENLKNRRV